MSEIYFESVSEELITKKIDPQDPRLGNFTEQISPGDLRPQDHSKIESQNPRVVVLGYPDDEGIQLNGGRPGAAKGPDEIRRHFYKMTPSPFIQASKPLRLFDIGNLILTDLTISEKHSRAQINVSELLSKGFHVSALGGGHDYGYSDFAAFSDYTIQKNKRPLIINFDAHLDVRPDEKTPHSGTPFFRLLNDYFNKIDFFEIGIQDWCNSSYHLKWLASKNGQLISFTDILNHPDGLAGCLEERVLSRIENHHGLGLSVCMDAFSSAFSPGASQVFPLGLDPHDFVKVWRSLCLRYKPRLISFYETSPPFDHDGRTAKLAAIFLQQWISLLST